MMRRRGPDRTAGRDRWARSPAGCSRPHRRRAAARSPCASRGPSSGAQPAASADRCWRTSVPKAASGWGQLDLHHAESSPLRSRSASPARAPGRWAGYRRAVAFGGPRATTGRRCHGRRAAPGSPAAAVCAASGWPRRPTGPASPSRASAPSASSSHSTTAAAPSGASTWSGQRADELGAVGGQLGRGLGHQRARPRRPAGPAGRRRPGSPPAAAFIRWPRHRPTARSPVTPAPTAAARGPRAATGPRRPSRPAGSRSAADSSASWLAASAEDRPSRSISAPLAIATTDSAGGCGADLVQIRRWRSMTAASRGSRIAAGHDHPPPANVTRRSVRYDRCLTRIGGRCRGRPTAFVQVPTFARPMIVTSGLPSVEIACGAERVSRRIGTADGSAW